jgi:hypothetical protein
MKLSLSVLAFALTIGSSLAQPLSLNWSNTYFSSGFDLHPTGLATVGTGVGRTQDILVPAWAAPVGGGLGSGIVVSVRTPVTIPFSGAIDLASGFAPTAIANNAPFSIGSDIRVLGEQYGALGSNTRYFGGGTSQLSGPLDFEYQASASTNYVEPLGIAPYPYGDFSCASIQPGARDLAIFHTKAGGTNPSVAVLDTSINPVAAKFADNLILVSGADNNAGPQEGARATVYTLNASTGAATAAFTKTVANTLVNHVFTSHEFVWGAFSKDFNVLADNRTVHDSTSGTIDHSFTLTAYNGSGTQLWQSASRPGNVVRVAVGSTSSIYTLNNGVPGEVLSAFDSQGKLMWQRSTKATRIAAVLDQGVVTADSEVDATGHHHVHLARFARSGSMSTLATYASLASNDDTVRYLDWIGGSIFISGETISAGANGIFAAQYDFPALQTVILADHPVGYWPLDDPVGSKTAHDLSGNNYSGTVFGAITFGSAGTTGATSATFSGGHIEVPDSQGTRFPSTNLLSVEVWYKVDTYSNSPQELVGKGFDRTPGCWGLYADVYTDHPVFEDYKHFDSPNGRSVYGATQPRGTWHQLVAVVSGSKLDLYIDGQINATTTYIPRPDTENTEPMCLGDLYHWSYPLQGQMSDVAVYAGALTSAQIQAHWLAGTAH